MPAPLCSTLSRRDVWSYHATLTFHQIVLILRPSNFLRRLWRKIYAQVGFGLGSGRNANGSGLFDRRAAPTARLVPVEIAVDNPQQRFGAGLLARVTFSSPGQARVIIRQSALAGEEEGQVSTRSGKIFVVKDNQAQARPVQLGDRRNGQVEILAGLSPGEQYVSRSGRPLKSGDEVRPSILSEP